MSSRYSARVWTRTPSGIFSAMACLTVAVSAPSARWASMAVAFPSGEARGVSPSGDAAMTVAPAMEVP